MVRYEFYGDTNILGLRFDDGKEVFIDLPAVHGQASLGPSEDASVVLYRFPEEVLDLFGSYGCAEQCPVDGEDRYSEDYDLAQRTVR